MVNVIELIVIEVDSNFRVINRPYNVRRVTIFTIDCSNCVPLTNMLKLVIVTFTLI